MGMMSGMGDIPYMPGVPGGNYINSQIYPGMMSGMKSLNNFPRFQESENSENSSE